MDVTNAIQIIRFQREEKHFYETALRIRKSVFIEEQGVDPELEYEHEEGSVFFLISSHHTPAGTGRWRETNAGIKLERFAILREFRNLGLGTVMLKEILREVVPHGKRIYLHSQLRAVHYYQRAGFRIKGEMFSEAGIDHYLMEYAGEWFSTGDIPASTPIKRR